jgi:hypothetical protein
MEIKELGEKYKLTKNDVWKCHDNWVVSHAAIERIASYEMIALESIQCLTSERELVRFLVTMKKGDKSITSVGEASKENCKSNYYGCMAEKRGVDRCVLKLINAYEYGIYGDSEMEDFKKSNRTDQ